MVVAPERISQRSIVFNGIKIATSEVPDSRAAFVIDNDNHLNFPVVEQAFIEAGITIRAANRTFVVPEPENSKYILLRNANSEIRFTGTLAAPVVKSIDSPFVANYDGDIKMFALAREIIALDYELKIYPRCYSKWVCNIQVPKTRGNIVHRVSENEQVAIETLREMISETEYRRYIKYGFILVQGESGAIYQIFRNQSHTKVWKGGKLIEEICVRIKNANTPLTDNVIAFKTIIQIDEEEFRKSGNIFKKLAA